MLGVALGCATPATDATRVIRADPPSAAEQYCAWYGDAREGVLYFGMAPFWSAMRAGGDDPRADLATPGPQRIGRFDLITESLLPPLDVTAAGARSGVWDVHAHPNGRVYYTTFYEPMGSVDAATGAVTRYPELGLGLNEIAALPDGNLLVTRYGADGENAGSLLRMTPEGERIAEYPVPAPDGWTTAPKTPAWDASSRRYWTTNDLIGDEPGEVATDATVLDETGTLVRRFDHPEVQFVSALPDGGFASVASLDSGLRLTRSGPHPVDVPLDPEFDDSLDFAQDLKARRDGSLVVTRWSGWVHTLAPGGEHRRTRLPRIGTGGLYYTAVRHADRICATHCGAVEVVCTDAP